MQFCDLRVTEANQPQLAEFDGTKSKMQIINCRLLIKAVLKGKNIFGTRPLIHTQKKKNYDCFTLIKIKNMYTVE